MNEWSTPTSTIWSNWAASYWRIQKPMMAHNGLKWNVSCFAWTNQNDVTQFRYGHDGPYNIIPFVWNSFCQQCDCHQNLELAPQQNRGCCVCTQALKFKLPPKLHALYKSPVSELSNLSWEGFFVKKTFCAVSFEPFMRLIYTCILSLCASGVA